MTDLDAVAASLRTWAETTPEIGRLYLFGSRVRGSRRDGTPVRDDSDLDIAIELVIPVGTPPDEICDEWDRHEHNIRSYLESVLPFRLDLQELDWIRTPHIAKAVCDASFLVYEAGYAAAEAKPSEA